MSIEKNKLINAINTIDVKFKELEDNNNALKQKINLNEKNNNINIENNKKLKMKQKIM